MLRIATRATANRISKQEAVDAIYIDFEGFANHPPSLLGVLVGDTLEQVVLEERLRGAAEAKKLRVEPLASVIGALVKRCECERRLLVAYSQHEKDVILQYAGIDLGELYRDARKIAKHWKNARHRDRPIAGYGLKDFLDFIEYHRGKHLGERRTTSRLKAVLDMLDRRSSYEDLTPVVKAKWTKLLEHNEVDCCGMQALVKMAAGELGPQ